MRTIICSLLALLCITTADAQRRKHRKHENDGVLPPPKVWIANIPTYNTTYDLIAANPMLITDSPGCKVSVFTISLTAPGEPFYGPFHAIGNTMNEMQRGAIERWKDKKNITLLVQDIHLNCHEKDATSPPLKYYYNEDEKGAE